MHGRALMRMVISNWAFIGLLLLGARVNATELRSSPQPIGSVQLAAGYPDGLGASLALQAIPFVEVETGGGLAFAFFTAFARLGPSWMLADGRGTDSRGSSLRLSVLGGFRAYRAWEAEGSGPELVGAIDFTRWLRPRFGVSLRLTGGAFIVMGRAVFPSGRLSAGLSF